MKGNEKKVKATEEEGAELADEELAKVVGGGNRREWAELEAE